ncbi:two-component regulator propeller domain-containing protein, partial [Spirosoma litoris]
VRTSKFTQLWGFSVKFKQPHGKTVTTLTDKDGKTFRNVWSIIKDKKGNIWFGADGLWRYDGSAFTQIDQTGAGVIIEDQKGNVLTSIGGPIFRYDEESLSIKQPPAKQVDLLTRSGHSPQAYSSGDPNKSKSIDWFSSLRSSVS